MGPSDPAPSNLGGANLVVCTMLPASLGDPADGCRQHGGCLKEGGFLLLHTLLRGHPLGETVTFLTCPEPQQPPYLLSQVLAGLGLGGGVGGRGVGPGWGAGPGAGYLARLPSPDPPTHRMSGRACLLARPCTWWPWKSFYGSVLFLCRRLAPRDSPPSRLWRIPASSGLTP